MPKNRIHQLFPRPEEVKENLTLAYSDHLPILARADMGVGKSPLVMLSLNTLGPGVGNGLVEEYKQENGQAVKWEDDDNTKARYAKMVDGLANTVKYCHADVIMLQETVPDFIEDTLKHAFPTWEIISDRETGQVTCINTQKFDIIETHLDAANRIRSCTLKNKITEQLIDVHNVWGIFNPFPAELEKRFMSTLQSKQISKASVSVILGDSNSRLAPLDDICRNITTGAVPLGYNEENGAEKDIQMPDYPDGGFYLGEDGMPRQLPTVTLDFETGAEYSDDRTKEQLGDAFWPEYRMVMCLDQTYQTQKFINNMTIFEYQEYLNKGFNGDQLMVRIAANCFNEKAIGLRFAPDSKLCQKLQEVFLDHEDIQFKTVTFLEKYPCIYVPLEKADLLHQTIMEYSASVAMDFALEQIAASDLSFQREKDHAHLVGYLKLIVEDMFSANDIQNFFEQVGIGKGNHAGDHPQLSLLRSRRKGGIFHRQYRETNDSQVLAEAGIERAKKILAENQFVVATSEEDAIYKDLFTRNIVRNKQRDTADLDWYEEQVKRPYQEAPPVLNF